jgi:hypothetical protein
MVVYNDEYLKIIEKVERRLLPYSKKSRFQFRCWNHAFTLPTEPLVPVSCDPVVDEVSYDRRHNDEYIKQWPEPIHSFSDFQGSPAFI